MVVIQGVLLPGLADASAVNSRRQAVDDKALPWAHLEEVKAGHKVYQAFECTYDLGIVRCPAGRILSRISSIQVIETSSAPDDELPRFHLGVGDCISGIPNRVPGGLVKFNRFVVPVL